MKANQKGFTVVEVLVVAAVVGLLGFIGWRVYESQGNKNNSHATQTQTEPTKQAEKKESPYTTYTHPADGYSFQYPKGWKVELAEDSTRVIVTSPDYDDSNGARFLLNKGKIVDGSPKLADVLSNKNGIDEEAKKIAVDGKEAVRFKRTYPSVSIKTYVYTGEYLYEQSYYGPASADYAKYLAVYDHLIDTFKIN